MFIEELSDAFFKYRKKQRAYLRHLEKRAHQLLKQINQPIFFRDLVVRTPLGKYGEASQKNQNNTEDEQTRLLSHLQFLFNLANEEHRANYCKKGRSNSYQIKEGKENHITRLSTNEFSLYTRRPMSIDTFQELLSKIESMASQLEPNVHILLSSFAVRDKSGSLLNMVMYVEGGKEPSIRAFAKNKASNVDIDYQEPDLLFSQQKQRNKTTFHANIVAGNLGGNSISTGSVFEVTTKGGAKYTQAIDICLDHSYKHSKALMSRRILTDAEPDEIFPMQVEQCVTSNSINIHEEGIISSTVLHADPRYSMIKNCDYQADNRHLEEDVMVKIMPDDYKNMSVKYIYTGYIVEHPPFGQNLKIDVLQERPAGQYLPKIKKEVLAHNKKTYAHMLETLQESCVEKKEKIIHAAEKKTVLLERVQELEQTLLKRCKPGFWQWLFNTVEYRQKVQAKKIIEQSIAFMQNIIHKGRASSLFFIMPWKKEITSKIQSLQSSIKSQFFFLANKGQASPLITKLTQDIHNIIDVGLIKNDLQIDGTPPKDSSLSLD